jgi:hypothetical protein
MTIFVLGEGSGEWDGLVGTSLKASDACLELFDFADMRRSGAAPLQGDCELRVIERDPRQAGENSKTHPLQKKNAKGRPPRLVAVR